jgi:hypothetical protein
MHFDPDAPEVLSKDELNLLRAQLELVGVGWSYGRGMRGIHTASRHATDPQQQASLSAEGLLAAVSQRERELESLDPSRVEIRDGLSSTEST